MDLVFYVELFGVDIFVVIEIWFLEIDDVCRVEIILFGYKLFDYIWFDWCGGGIVLLIRENLYVSCIDVGECIFFEFFYWMVEF